MVLNFNSPYTKVRTVQTRLAWPLHKNDMQICDALHTFKSQTYEIGYLCGGRRNRWERMRKWDRVVGVRGNALLNTLLYSSDS